MHLLGQFLGFFTVKFCAIHRIVDPSECKASIVMVDQGVNHVEDPVVAAEVYKFSGSDSGSWASTMVVIKSFKVAVTKVLSALDRYVLSSNH